MRINFSFFSGKVFYRNLLIFGVLVCFAACNKQKPPMPEFTLNTPGGEVTQMHNNNSPKVMVYYKVDEKGNTTQEVVGEAFFYENQQEYVSGGLKDGKRDGKWYAFFPDGKLQSEIFYKDGKKHGAYNVYREDGQPLIKGNYNLDICEGTWTWYDEAGKQTKKIKANENTIACEWCPRCLKLKQK